MHFARVARCLMALALALVLVLRAPGAQAQATGLPAVISTGGSGLDAAAVQSAVEHELGVPLSIDASATERLEITLTGRRANVTYYAPGREPVTRSVDLPRDNARALATIAFLAGNLARDEAAELLRQLSPAPAGSETAAVPPPPPVPAAEPASKPAPAPQPQRAAESAARPKQPELIEKKPLGINASLYYPITVLKQTERRRLNLELGLAYSRVGAIRGVGLALGYLHVEGPLEGVSYAFLWNRAGPVKGVQLGTIVNEGHGTLEGLSYAGIANVRDGDVFGVQASSIYVQSKAIEGVQAAGIFASSSGIQGVQAAGVVSISGDVRGVQAASILSVAKDVNGAQAGVVNVAGRVHGVQIGVVNLADEIHGGAIGLVSIAKNGRLQPVLWLAGPSATPVISVKSVTDLTYSQLGVGYDLGQSRYRQDGSLGMHFELPRHFYAETGAGYDETHDDKSDKLVRGEVHVDARVGFEPVHGVVPFIGGSVTRRTAGRGGDYRGEYSFGVALF
jgi:hypothetical protein